MKRHVPSGLYGDYPAQLAFLTTILPSGCWEFGGYITPHGYGQLSRNIGAHRLAWEIENGCPVPAGLVIDHLCHNADPACNDSVACRHRRCVNPAHMEAVTSAANVMRGKSVGPINAAKTHCAHGHEYTPENTYYRPDRYGRICKTCRDAALVLISQDPAYKERHRLAERARRAVA
jgi:hypothetical protein